MILEKGQLQKKVSVWLRFQSFCIFIAYRFNFAVFTHPTQDRATVWKASNHRDNKSESRMCACTEKNVHKSKAAYRFGYLRQDNEWAAILNMERQVPFW